MTLDISREKNDKAVSFRLSVRLDKKMRTLAKMYAGGDVSLWIRHCVDHYSPKEVKKKTRSKRSSSERAKRNN